ncbi:MAG: hypothetical protein QXS05_07925 [Candidatus Bathyarchaeia archaeon]
MNERCFIEKLRVWLPWSDDINILFEKTTIADHVIPNRLVVHPMEAADAEASTGAPTARTIQRYKKYGNGGSGIIWCEATAISLTGRSNPYQLVLTDQTLPAFKTLVNEIRASAAKCELYHDSLSPLLILQLTHAGRQSLDFPRITHHSQILDPIRKIDRTHPCLTDEELEKIAEDFVHAAVLAREAGFDGVDIKACHGYLIHETLYSYTRVNSKYGGTFENRTQLLCDIVSQIKKREPCLLITSRLNFYDGIPFPWGWGTDENGAPAIGEVVQLISKLYALGVRLISTAYGNPYYDPTIERPSAADDETRALENVLRMFTIAREIKRHVPHVLFVLTGFSWLRDAWPYVAAGCIASGFGDYAGLGRGALANPFFPQELFTSRKLSRVCTACSSCAQLLRRGQEVRCVVYQNQEQKEVKHVH